jgi:hypothetical protein
MPTGSRIVLRTAAEADIPTPDTDQSALFMDADDSNAPAWKDDGGTVHALTGAAGADAPALVYLDHGNTGSTETVDASVADVQRLVANAATVTLTITGAPASGTPGVVQLWLEQDGTGGRDWVFPGSVDWGSVGEPTWTDRAGGDVDLVNLETVDSGTTWIAVLAGRPGATGAAGSNGTNGTNGTNGSVGGAVEIPYTFSTTTTDSDPGNGNLRLSNATQTSATVIRADLLASDTTDWSAALATLADSTNTVKGHIRLFKTSDPTKWLVFSVSALASPSGYKNITVANVAGSASSPLTNGDAITLSFTRAGDVGASGTASVGSDPIWDAAGDLAVGTGADTAAKLVKGSDGTVLTMDPATHLPVWAAIGARTEYTLSGDVTITTGGTFYDGPTTGSAPAAGVYDVWARLSIRAGASNNTYYVGRLIANGSATPIDEAETAITAITDNVEPIILTARVTADGTNPILTRASSPYTNDKIIRDPVHYSSAIHRASVLVLTRVG